MLWAQRLQHAAHMLRCTPLKVASRVLEARLSTSEAVNGLSAQHLQRLKGRFNGLFEGHAAGMVQSRGNMTFNDFGPQSQTSDQP